jgi:hypothetical protein
VLFLPRDIPGIWPMVRHYFFFGPKPPTTEAYNPLQKQAYTTVLILGVLSVLTGFAIWKPVQFSWLAWLMGGFHYARIWHFAVMWAIIFFIFGHLVMVILHGWSNFVSMLTGWKTNPDYPVGWEMPAPFFTTPAEGTKDEPVKRSDDKPAKDAATAEASPGKSTSPPATHDESSPNEQKKAEPRN